MNKELNPKKNIFIFEILKSLKDKKIISMYYIHDKWLQSPACIMYHTNLLKENFFIYISSDKEKIYLTKSGEKYIQPYLKILNNKCLYYYLKVKHILKCKWSNFLWKYFSITKKHY